MEICTHIKPKGFMAGKNKQSSSQIFLLQQSSEWIFLRVHNLLNKSWASKNHRRMLRSKKAQLSRSGIFRLKKILNVISVKYRHISSRDNGHKTWEQSWITNKINIYFFFHPQNPTFWPCGLFWAQCPHKDINAFFWGPIFV